MGYVHCRNGAAHVGRALCAVQMIVPEFAIEDMTQLVKWTTYLDCNCMNQTHFVMLIAITCSKYVVVWGSGIIVS